MTNYLNAQCHIGCDQCHVCLPVFLKWFMQDFGDTPTELLEWIREYLPDSALASFLDVVGGDKKSHLPRMEVDFGKPQWSLKLGITLNPRTLSTASMSKFTHWRIGVIVMSPDPLPRLQPHMTIQAENEGGQSVTFRLAKPDRCVPLGDAASFAYNIVHSDIGVATKIKLTFEPYMNTGVLFRGKVVSIYMENMSGGMSFFSVSDALIQEGCDTVLHHGIPYECILIMGSESSQKLQVALNAKVEGSKSVASLKIPADVFEPEGETNFKFMAPKPLGDLRRVMFNVKPHRTTSRNLKIQFSSLLIINKISLQGWVFNMSKVFKVDPQGMDVFAVDISKADESDIAPIRKQREVILGGH
eukprot:Clim_evm10s247 gene=Clim_evmTU10s247